MNPLDPNLFYDFSKLASVCKELDFKYELLTENDFKITWCGNIYLIFANLVDELAKRVLYSDYLDNGPIDNFNTTMVYNDYTHVHGIDIEMGLAFDFTLQSPPIHYLDIPLFVRTGEIFIYEHYRQNILELQWLVYATDLTKEFKDLEPGEEVRIIRV